MELVGNLREGQTKVAIVCPYFSVVSNEAGLAVELRKRGYIVDILTTSSKAPREHTVEQGDGVFRFRTLIDLPDNPIAFGVYDKIVKECYDVVMLQEDYPFICWQGFLAGRKIDAKIICSSERYYYPRGIKGVVLRFLDLTICRFIRNRSVFTVHSTSSKEFFKETLDRDSVLIPVGVDKAVFKPMQVHKFLLGNPIILTVIRDHYYKGIDILEQVARNLEITLPEARIYVIGVIKPNLKNVVYLGRVSHNFLVNYYNQCDLYVQLSRREPFGIAHKEALACGCKTFTSREGGLKDSFVLDWKEVVDLYESCFDKSF